jgi:hypothetical protein
MARGAKDRARALATADNEPSLPAGAASRTTIDRDAAWAEP